jgi:hypothetical protein
MGIYANVLFVVEQVLAVVPCFYAVFVTSKAINRQGGKKALYTLHILFILKTKLQVNPRPPFIINLKKRAGN